MSRPPGAPADHFVDAVHASRTGSRFERHYAAGTLPRLAETGAGAASELNAVFNFWQLEGHATIDGVLTGAVLLTCQRCLKLVAVDVDESFQVVLVKDEDAAPEEFGEYEPIAVDPTRLDLRWLAEEQTLLALPLVPMHRPGECVAANEADDVVADSPPRQQPFGNLRDLLQKR